MTPPLFQKIDNSTFRVKPGGSIFWIRMVSYDTESYVVPCHRGLSCICIIIKSPSAA